MGKVLRLISIAIMGTILGYSLRGVLPIEEYPWFRLCGIILFIITYWSGRYFESKNL